MLKLSLTMIRTMIVYVMTLRLSVFFEVESSLECSRSTEYDEGNPALNEEAAIGYMSQT